MTADQIKDRVESHRRTWLVGTSAEIITHQDSHGWFWRHHPAWVGAGVIARQEDAIGGIGPNPADRHETEEDAVLAAMRHQQSHLAHPTPGEHDGTNWVGLITLGGHYEGRNWIPDSTIEVA